MFKYEIRSINLRNFRNFSEIYLDFEKKDILNNKGIFFIGQNGIGKTSILEAISMLYPGRGIRSAKYFEIIRNNHIKNENSNINNSWDIISSIHNGFSSNEINVQFIKNKKNVFVNNKKILKLSNLLEYNSLIWIAQDDYHNFLISNSFRRNFFDRLISIIRPVYIDYVSEYNYFLIQKQNLLKQIQYSIGQKLDLQILFELNKKLSSLAMKISSIRFEIISIFNQFAPSTNFSLIPHIEIIENFDFKIDCESELCKKMNSIVNDEIKQKRVLFGTHLSKINIKEIRNNIMIHHLSSGEQRILLNNLVLSQIKIYINSFNLYPIILLDDILTFFDEKNQKILIDELLDLGVQFFITTNILINQIKDLECQFIFL